MTVGRRCIVDAGRRRGGVARGVVVILGWVLASGLFLSPACGPRTTARARLAVGTFWGGRAAEALHRELLAIARQVGTASIEVRTFTFSGFSEYLFESQPRGAEEALDLVVVPNDWLGRLWQRRLIAEIPPSQVAAIQGELVKQAMLTVTDDDHVLGFPIAAEVLALVYDPERFPSPPQSLDELLSAPLPDDVLPFGIDLSSPRYLAPLVSAEQGLLVDASGAFAWSPEALHRVVAHLRPAWGTPEGWKVCTSADLVSLQLQLFLEGRLASFLAGPWLLESLESSGRPFAVVPIPPLVGSPYPSRALVGYQCVAVARSSPWVDLALELAAALCRREINERLNRDSRRLPVQLASYKTQKAMATPGTVGFLRALEDGQLFPSEARWSESFQRAAGRLQRLAARSTPPSPDDVETILLGGHA